MNKDEQTIGKCPYCKGEVDLREIEKQTIGTGFLKQEIMYICTHCKIVLGFSREKYMS